MAFGKTLVKGLECKPDNEQKPLRNPFQMGPDAHLIQIGMGMNNYPVILGFFVLSDETLPWDAHSHAPNKALVWIAIIFLS